MQLIDYVNRDKNLLEPLIIRSAQIHNKFKELLKDKEKTSGIKKKSREKLLRDIDSYRILARGSIDSVWNIIQDPFHKLLERDKSDMAVLLAYLSINKRYFRSGYIKIRILRGLRKVVLTDEEKEILSSIFFDQIDKAGTEFVEFLKIIPSICDNDFKDKLKNLVLPKYSYIEKRLERIHGRVKKLQEE